MYFATNSGIMAANEDVMVRRDAVSIVHNLFHSN